MMRSMMMRGGMKVMRMYSIKRFYKENAGIARGGRFEGAAVFDMFKRTIRTSTDRLRRQRQKRRKFEVNMPKVPKKRSVKRKRTKGLFVERRTAPKNIFSMRTRRQKQILNRLTSRVSVMQRELTRRTDDVLKSTLERPKPPSTRLAVLGHVWNLTHLFAFCIQDIIGLRTVSSVGSMLGMTYNYMHPSGPLWLPIFWGGVFLALNVFFIGKHLIEDRVSFTSEELEFFEKHFHMPHKISPRIYVKIRDRAETKEFTPGSKICSEFGHVDHVFMIISGQVKLTSVSGNVPTHVYANPGMMIGNVGVSNLTPDTYMSTGVTETYVTVFSWTLETFRDMLQDKDLETAVLKLIQNQTIDDVTQLKDSIENELAEWTYENMLRASLSEGTFGENTREELSNFIQRHEISKEREDEILRLVGWTRAEFERGAKDNLYTAPGSLMMSITQALSGRGIINK